MNGTQPQRASKGIGFSGHNRIGQQAIGKVELESLEPVWDMGSGQHRGETRGIVHAAKDDRL